MSYVIDVYREKGKKVGTFFTWHGADDFELITPKFETSFIEEQPMKGEKREGSFEESLLFMENMRKDLYGGTARLRRAQLRLFRGRKAEYGGIHSGDPPGLRDRSVFRRSYLGRSDCRI